MEWLILGLKDHITNLQILSVEELDISRVELGKVHRQNAGQQTQTHRTDNSVEAQAERLQIQETTNSKNDINKMYRHKLYIENTKQENAETIKRGIDVNNNERMPDPIPLSVNPERV